MDRPTMRQVMVDFLESLRLRSTCSRTQQACLITDPGFKSIYAMGYNGSAAGLPHDCRGDQGKCGCVHAETNAMVKLRTERSDLVLYCTTCPCELCAKMIINSGQIVAVHFLVEYRDKTGLELMKKAKLWVRHGD